MSKANSNKFSNIRFNVYEEIYSTNQYACTEELTCVEIPEIQTSRRYYGFYLKQQPVDDNTFSLRRKQGSTYTTYKKVAQSNKILQNDEFMVDFKHKTGNVQLSAANLGNTFEIVYNAVGTCNTVENEARHIKTSAIQNNLNTTPTDIGLSANILTSNSSNDYNKYIVDNVDKNWSR